MTTFWWYRNHYSHASLLLAIGDDAKIVRVITGQLGWQSLSQKQHYMRKLLGVTIEEAGNKLSQAWELHDVVKIEEQPEGVQALAVMLGSVRERFGGGNNSPSPSNLKGHFLESGQWVNDPEDRGRSGSSL